MNDRIANLLETLKTENLGVANTVSHYDGSIEIPTDHHAALIIEEAAGRSDCAVVMYYEWDRSGGVSEEVELAVIPLPETGVTTHSIAILRGLADWAIEGAQ